MVKELCFTVAGLLVVVLLGAQSPDMPKRGFSIAYFNEQIARPGLRVGYETALWNKIKTQSNGNSRWRSLISKSHLGFYSHFRNHTGVFLNTQLGFRFTSPSGLYTEPLHFGIGYLHTFLGAKTFEVDEAGNVEPISLAGNSNLFLPYLTLIGVGYDFRKKRDKPFSVYCAVDVFLQYPENNASKLRLSIPVGFTYYF